MHFHSPIYTNHATLSPPLLQPASRWIADYSSRVLIDVLAMINRFKAVMWQLMEQLVHFQLPDFHLHRLGARKAFECSDMEYCKFGDTDLVLQIDAYIAPGTCIQILLHFR